MLDVKYITIIFNLFYVINNDYSLMSDKLMRIILFLKKMDYES